MIIAHLPWQSPFFEEPIQLERRSQSGEEGTGDRDTASIDPSYERRENLRILALKDAFISNVNAFEVCVCKVLECLSGVQSLDNANFGAKR